MAPKKPAKAADKTTQAKTPSKGGRPSSYSPERALPLLMLVSEGLSLRQACKVPGMPSRPTVFKWIANYPEFANRYAHAKSIGAEILAEEILEIADDGRNDWMEVHDQDGNAKGWKLNGEHVQRSKLRIDSRKWLLAKLQPKKYGEKVALDHDVPEDSPLAALIGAINAKGSTLTPSDNNDA